MKKFIKYSFFLIEKTQQQKKIQKFDKI